MRSKSTTGTEGRDTEDTESRRRVGSIAGLLLLFAAACSTPPERLVLEGRTIAIFNDSGESWRDVEVWVNDHYRVTRETIAPDERFVVTLDSFVAGFGQRFPPNQMVNGIEVRATDESGDSIRLVHGSGRRQ